MPDRQKYYEKYISDGKVNDLFKTEVIEGSVNGIVKQINENRYGRGVCCLSEKHDDVLMWSHYSNGHKGFCLKFETSYEPFYIRPQKLDQRIRWII